LLGLALLPLLRDFFPTFLVEEYGGGLRDEAGNGEEDYALCKTISILSIFKIFSAKIALEPYQALLSFGFRSKT
jgi:hypothetical protein